MKFKNLYKKVFLLVYTLYSVKTKAYENNQIITKESPCETQSKNYFVATSDYITKKNFKAENAVVLKNRLKQYQISKLNNFKSYGAPEKEISSKEAHIIFAKELVKLGFATVTQGFTYMIQFLNLTKDYIVFFLETPVEKQEEKEFYIRELISQEELKKEEEKKLRKANLSAIWDNFKKITITFYSDIIKPWIIISITNKDVPSIGSFVKLNMIKKENVIVNQSNIIEQIFDFFKKFVLK
jgi:hypothetical protein